LSIIKSLYNEKRTIQFFENWSQKQFQFYQKETVLEG
jgi:hypothetical protein